MNGVAEEEEWAEKGILYSEFEWVKERETEGMYHIKMIWRIRKGKRPAMKLRPADPVRACVGPIPCFSIFTENETKTFFFSIEQKAQQK